MGVLSLYIHYLVFGGLYIQVKVMTLWLILIVNLIILRRTEISGAYIPACSESVSKGH